MYKVMYDDTGNICEMTKVMEHSVPGFNSAVIPEKYTHLFKEVEDGKNSLTKLKVDIESQEFSIINLSKPKKVLDDTFGTFTRIYPSVKEHELNIVIKSIHSRPHIVVTSTHEENRKFFVYITKKLNLNYLYQSFECDTNKVNIFEIDQIDYRKLFKNDFSLYYKKIFNSAGYTIE